MEVKVRLSSLLRQSAGWKESVTLEAETPLRCLQALIDHYPDMRRWIYDKDGNLWDRLQLFINDGMIHRHELSHPLSEGDELYILLNIGGG